MAVGSGLDGSCPQGTFAIPSLVPSDGARSSLTPSLHSSHPPVEIHPPRIGARDDIAGPIPFRPPRCRSPTPRRLVPDFQDLDSRVWKS